MKINVLALFVMLIVSPFVFAAEQGKVDLLTIQRETAARDLPLDHVMASQKHSYKPDAGYVPDSGTAIKIAEAVLAQIYTQKQIDTEKPLNAVLKDGIWEITGTLNCAADPSNACVGGVALIEIAKDDGRILRVSHGQ